MLRCPTTGTKKQQKLGLVGCGSTNITKPDEEGLHDCLDCGLWFKATERSKSNGTRASISKVRIRELGSLGRLRIVRSAP